MKINSAEDAATNLHLINNTAHPKNKHTYCERASRREKKFPSFVNILNFSSVN